MFKNQTQKMYASIYKIWIAIGLFCIIFGYRLGYLQMYGDSYVWRDGWEVDPIILSKWLSKDLSISDFLAAHSEHRIIITRIINISLVALSSAWDNFLQVTVAAFLMTISCITACLYTVKLKTSIFPNAIFSSIIIGMSLGSHDNALWGFQVCWFVMYLMQLTLIISIGSNSSVLSIIGVSISGSISLFSLGSGILLVFAGTLSIITAVFFRLISKQDALLRAIPLFGLIVLGGLMFTGSTHSGATNMRDFTLTCSKNMAWPWCLNATGLMAPLTAIFQWIPIIILSYMVCKKQSYRSKMSWFCLSFASTIILQAMALAYARGEGGVPPHVRYLDMLSWGFLVQAVSWRLVVTRTASKKMKVLCVVWHLTTVLGIFTMTYSAWAQHGPAWREHMQQQREIVKKYRDSEYDLALLVDGKSSWFKGFGSPIPSSAIRWANETNMLPQGDFGHPAQQGRHAKRLKAVFNSWKEIMGVGWVMLIASLVLFFVRNRWNPSISNKKQSFNIYEGFER